MTHNRKSITNLGPTQTRHCHCPHPQRLNNDQCHRCGYPPHPLKRTGSTRQLAEALARTLLQ